MGGEPASEPKGLYARVETDAGLILVRLERELAPRTVENFVALAKGTTEWVHPETGKRMKSAYFEGSEFFRVLPGFLIQGGDPAGEGWGGPGYALDPETATAGLRFDRPGRVAAAATKDGRQHAGQFFITLSPAPHLDGKHAVFGEVVQGLDAAVRIAESRRGPRADRPAEPARILKVTVEERP